MLKQKINSWARKMCFCYLLVPALLLAEAAPAYAQYEHSRSAQFLFEVAKQHLEREEYHQALQEFQKVLLLNPYNEQAREYIELIKEMSREGKYGVSEQQMEEMLDELELDLEIGDEPESSRAREQAILSALESQQQKVAQRKGLKAQQIEAEDEITIRKESFEITPVETEFAQEYIPKREQAERITTELIKTLYLDDELWATQPKTVIELELGQRITLEGRSIARFLVEKPEKAEIERIHLDQLQVAGKDIGSSFVYLWDDRGRWIFNVRVIPAYIATVEEKRQLAVFEQEPFKFSYSTDRQSYYKRSEGGEFERESLSFTQWAQIAGPTPYGDFDASLRGRKYGEDHELADYTIGLTDGKIGNLTDFNIRGFDFYEDFSELSFPGQLLRGIFWEADTFNHNIHYAALRGREREGYGYLPPGIEQERKAYIEGARVTLFPKTNKTISLNFARGSGDDREDFLTDQVYSVEGNYNGEDVDFKWELAYDGSYFAGLFNSDFRFPNFDLGVDLRNIANHFTTISGRPSRRGEVGSVVRTNWRPRENLEIASMLDIYRARYNYNPGNPDKLNFDSDTTFYLRLNENSNLVNSISYINEPGLAFPRRYLNLRSTYSTSLRLWGREIYPFLGTGFSKSRNPLSNFSDYDSYRGFGGFRLPLTKGLSYWINGEYSWLTEDYSGAKGNPSFWETGFDYRWDPTPKLKVDFRTLYRNEQNTGLVHAFLAGEDSLEGTLRINYLPFVDEDTELFAEGRVRKVWQDPADEEDYLEANFFMGLRCSWDLPVRWNPQGRVSGVVFKDLNANGTREFDEPYLEAIKINIGKESFTTDKSGYFSTVVSGKKVLVVLDEDTLPEGFILTTPSSFDVEITPAETFVNFGASAFSSVYGTVFFDVNNNARLDFTDEVIPNVGLYLDGQFALTNVEGAYYFRQLQPGDYTLRLDINSLPLEFIPSVPLQKEIGLSEGINYNYSFPVIKK